jgi:hypothetical protein
MALRIVTYASRNCSSDRSFQSQLSAFQEVREGPGIHIFIEAEACRPGPVTRRPLPILRIQLQPQYFKIILNYLTQAQSAITVDTPR